jgi:hypothetical protein
MTAKSLERIFYREPFQPFRLRTSDGEELLVRQARKALVSGDRIAVVGVSRRNGGPGVEKLRIIAVDRVISAEGIGTK